MEGKAIFHIFPNTAHLKLEFDTSTEVIDFTLDDLMRNVRAYDSSGQELIIKDITNQGFIKYTPIKVVKDDTEYTGKLISINDKNVTFLKTTDDNIEELITINKFESLSTTETDNKIKIINNNPNPELKTYILADIDNYSWKPEYSLIVKNSELLNFIFGARIMDDVFLNVFKHNYNINELYLHTSRTQEDMRGVRYQTAMMAQSNMTSASKPDNTSQNIKMDLSYQIDIGDVKLNELKSFPIKQFSKLENFKEIYVIDIIKQNTKAYRSYVFNQDTFLPNGAVNVMDENFNLVSVGRINSYLNEKLITVIQEEEIQVAVEVMQEQISYETDEKMNQGPKKDLKQVPKVASKMAPKTDKQITGNKMETEFSIENNPLYDKEQKVKRNLYRDIFSIQIKNLKKKEIEIRLIYDYDGFLKQVTPEVSEYRPGQLLWNVKLGAGESNVIHGGVKYASRFMF